MSRTIIYITDDATEFCSHWGCPSDKMFEISKRFPGLVEDNLILLNGDEYSSPEKIQVELLNFTDLKKVVCLLHRVETNVSVITTYKVVQVSMKGSNVLQKLALSTKQLIKEVDGSLSPWVYNFNKVWDTYYLDKIICLLLYQYLSVDIDL